jgi:cytochrome c-type biogenesis protein
VTPLSIGGLYMAGLLTAFSPCAMSLLPLTVSYLGASSDGDSDSRGSGSQSSGSGADGESSLSGGGSSPSRGLRSILYALGLGCALSILGLASASAGVMYGSYRPADDNGLGYTVAQLPSLASAVFVLAMGLNLFGVLDIQFPDLSNTLSGSAWSSDSRHSNKNNNNNNPLVSGPLTDGLRAFLLGASSALVASPCSSPVLTSLLTLVAASGRPLLGKRFFNFFKSHPPEPAPHTTTITTTTTTTTIVAATATPTTLPSFFCACFFVQLSIRTHICVYYLHPPSYTTSCPYSNTPKRTPKGPSSFSSIR